MERHKNALKKYLYCNALIRLVGNNLYGAHILTNKEWNFPRD